MATDNTPSNGDSAGDISEPQQLFIGGEYVSSSDGGTFPVYNPMTGAKLYDCASATEDDYERAIQSAAVAYKTWSRVGPSAKRAIFFRAANILEKLMQTEAPALMSAEVSGTRFWTMVNTISAVDSLRETASLVSQIKGEILPTDKPGTTVLVERQPLGVVLGISPWNSPVGPYIGKRQTRLLRLNRRLLQSAPSPRP